MELLIDLCPVARPCSILFDSYLTPPGVIEPFGRCLTELGKGLKKEHLNEPFLSIHSRFDLKQFLFPQARAGKLVPQTSRGDILY